MTFIEVKNKGIRDLKGMTFSMSVGMVGRSSKPGERVLCSELRLSPPRKNLQTARSAALWLLSKLTAHERQRAPEICAGIHE